MILQKVLQRPHWSSQKKMSNILVIDDEVDILETLSAILQDEDHSVKTMTEFNENHSLDSYDLLILDVWLSNQNGIDILDMLRKKKPDLPILMISGHGNIEMAVDAVKRRAFDFIEKPLRLERVVTSIENALRMRDLNRQVIEARNLALQKDRLIGGNTLFKTIESILKAANTNHPIFLTGEPGSGKSFLAKHIYYQLEESYSNFVEVHLRMLPNREMATILFGKEHDGQIEKGKLEQPDSVIYLHEVSLLSNEAVSKLYSALTVGSFLRMGGTNSVKFDRTKVKLISSSKFGIKTLLEQKRISEDLIYELSHFEFQIPPLRDRKDDIRDLVAYYSQKYSNDLELELIEFSPEAYIYLQSYSWPGNARELQNLVERLTVLASNPKIDLETLQYFMKTESSIWQSPNNFTSLKDALQYFERSYILYAIQRNKGNITRASHELDIERTHLYRKMKKLGLQNIRSEMI